jgi:IS4 transposase
LLTFWTREGINTMRHHNSVLHGLTKQIPWAVFDRLVDEHGADWRVRRLSTKSQLIALLYGQLAGAVSLREIESGLESHQARLYHLGAASPSRSTLADANARRPHAVFAGLLAHLIKQAQPGLRRKIGDAVRLIDSTGLRLSGLGTDWAHFSAGVCGAKLHVVYDPDAERPLYVEVTTARVNDITPAKAMPIEAGATYVFDLGYYDFGWWATLDARGCRIVTRLKKNTPLAVIEEMTVPPGSLVLSDRIGHLPARLKYSRHNPFSDPIREVRVVTETGKELRILTNDLDAPADDIADLYKRRWQVELFFRWIKQTLRITHFLGTSENAVRIQIAVALIAYLLIRIAQAAIKTDQSPLAFARLIRANLMHRRPINRLTQPPDPIIRDHRQMSLSLSQF